MNPVTFDDWMALLDYSPRGDDKRYSIPGEITIPLYLGQGQCKKSLFLSFDSVAYTVEKGYLIVFYCDGEEVATYCTVYRYIEYQRTEQVLSLIYPSKSRDELARKRPVWKSHTATFKVTSPSLIKAIKD